MILRGSMEKNHQSPETIFSLPWTLPPNQTSKFLPTILNLQASVAKDWFAKI
jgi:hypothetical protein